MCMVSALLVGCVTLGGETMRTRRVSVAPSSGTFSLILYGGRYGEDLESVAVLDKEGDGYTLTPFAPDFDFKVRKGTAAKDALKEAEEFVSWHPNFVSSALSEISDDRGVLIGYELRPLYSPVAYGTLDVLDIIYTRKDDLVYFSIKLKPSVQRLIDGDGRRGDRW